MRTLRRLTAADARSVPWKNGRGVTEELAIWPPGADFARGFDWRISRAAVDEPGPFSAFPGFQRVLVVTSGAGLRLQHGTAAPRARVSRLAPYAFSGDWPTSATLIDGPVADFNVLTRRGAVSADVVLLRPGPRSLHVRELLQPGHTFLHVLSGTVDLRMSGAVPEMWRCAIATGDASATGAPKPGSAADDVLRFVERESLWIADGPAPAGTRRAAGASSANELHEPLQLEVGGGASEGLAILVQLSGEG